ncbi:MAG: hypothetical protein HQK79_23020 [Desulfobacterales bacterium]|nr:hypothetical protein [Desulfobacterales bacterium]
MALIEKDHLLNLSFEGLKEYRGGDALNDRIYEWFETPQGTISDNPSWGNALWLLKHEPPSMTLNVAAEMIIVEKIAKDIEDLSVKGIQVEFLEIDLMKITISHRFGEYNQTHQI